MALRKGTMLELLGPSQSRIAIRALTYRPASHNLHIQLSHRHVSSPLTVTCVFRARQIRQQSTSGHGQNPKQAPPPRPSFPRFLLAALKHSFGNITYAFRSGTLRTVFRTNPEELVLALVSLAVMACIGVYVVYLVVTYFYGYQFTRYPPPIAQTLRRALYYSNHAEDPKLALKYYKKALEQCDEHHLDPFSDEVIGLKIQIASWLEKIENYQPAISVLETLQGDCKRWVEVMEKSVQGKATELDTKISPTLNRSQEDNLDKEQETQPKENLWGKRTRILGKAVQIGVKLGALYSDEHVLDSDLALERLVWSVETTLKELRRRTIEGVKDGEGEWMSPEALGGALETLGHSYESRGQFQLAVPLFYQALQLCQDPCHIAVLMNNLAASFAQHPLLAPAEAPIDTLATSQPPVAPALTRKDYLESAQRWALNAHKHADETRDEVRTLECDEACAVSLCNLGDIASLLGDHGEARKRFEQAREASKKMNFAAGINQAESGLHRLPR